MRNSKYIQVAELNFNNSVTLYKAVIIKGCIDQQNRMESPEINHHI